MGGGDSLENRLRGIELIPGRCRASDGRLGSSARWNRDHGGSRCRSGALGVFFCSFVLLEMSIQEELKREIWGNYGASGLLWNPLH